MLIQSFHPNELDFLPQPIKWVSELIDLLQSQESLTGYLKQQGHTLKVSASRLVYEPCLPFEEHLCTFQEKGSSHLVRYAHLSLNNELVIFARTFFEDSFVAENSDQILQLKNKLLGSWLFNQESAIRHDLKTGFVNKQLPARTSTLRCDHKSIQVTEVFFRKILDATQPSLQ